MIIEWLITLSVGFAEWIVTLFPVLDLPDEVVNVDDMLNSVLAYGDGLGVWADWGFLGAVLAVPLVVWSSGLLIRAIRALIAHIPFVGGKG